MDPAFYTILFKAQVPQIGVLRLWLNVESWMHSATQYIRGSMGNTGNTGNTRAARLLQIALHLEILAALREL